ncbi:hypothetical protein G647_03880 [Cladophialophora carrionii CBS 160.54]|uniref:DUF1398 domain-containing protein n=1 Tax=Cladophialophora carrionii CBS 160.54 TaxID=1279043 RepID=V9DCV6_9EURO|nr:uncharacterized protein G647_03880 [Cladophialophora carrionii CBS 160.54]ETI24511.1 hypothetical protein G647_03880 [Cladophialophora carrionii CBS 160.54]
MPTLTPVAKIFAQVHSPRGLRFPETVASLLALGVTRYHVDYTSSLITAYSASNTSSRPRTITTEQITFVGPTHSGPNIDVNPNATWDPTGVKTAIKRIQTGESSTYADFSSEITAAGVVGYFAFLEGKRVVYYGPEGEVHVEWFPGDGPGPIAGKAEQ